MYYACGAWKNKGTRICNSNGIRADKANDHVFKKLGKVLSNDKLIKQLVKTVNKERKANVNSARKELEHKEKELQKLNSKKQKVLESYEEEIITKQDFSECMGQIKDQEHELTEIIQELKFAVWDNGQEAITVEEVKEVFDSFNKLMEECATIEQQQKLLHILLTKINEDCEIEAMEITVNQLLLQYIEKVGLSMVGNLAFVLLFIHENK